MKENNEEVLKPRLTSSFISTDKNLNTDKDRYLGFTMEDPMKKELQNNNIVNGEQHVSKAVHLSISEDSLYEDLERISFENKGKHSDEWKALYAAASKMQGFLLKLDNKIDTDEGLLDLFTLSEACNHYYNTHLEAGGKKADARKQIVMNIQRKISAACAAAAGGQAKKAPVTAEQVRKRKKGASENVKRLSEYYAAFSKKIGEDVVGSPEEKLRRRWNVLRSCEEDIRIYRYTHTDDSKISPEVLHVLNDYENIRPQIMFLDKLEEAGAHKALFENKTAKDVLEKTYRTEGKELPSKVTGSKDKGREELTDEQLAGLSEIDTWVVRNFNNGGYMACFGGTTDRSDIIHSLLSLSRRERMYVYYLVEKRERVNPSMEGFGVSQTSYVPDVKAFKSRMIANKLKFYSRFSGGYIYWNKISQAMAIATRTRPLLQTAEENAKILKKKEDLISDDGLIKNIRLRDEHQDDKDDQIQKDNKLEQKQNLQLLYTSLQSGKELLDKIRKEKKADKKRQLEDRLKAVRQKAGEALAALQELDEKIEKKNLKAISESVEGAGVNKASKKADVKQYLSGMPGDIGGITLKTGNLIKEQVLGFSKETSDSILSVLAPGNATLGAINSVIGFVFSAIALVDGAAGMSWMEITESGLGLTASLAGVASKGAGFVKLFTGADNVLTGKTYASGLIVADLALQGVHITTMTRDEYHRMKASQKLKKLIKDKKIRGKKAEFAINMNRLQDRISDSRAKTSFTKLALSGAMVSTLFVCPPVAAVIAAVGFVGGIVNRVVENRRKRANKYYLFDKHFKIEEQADELIKEKKVKETVDKETLMSQLRRRVASSVGFASPSDAADAFAKRYAQKMIELANAGGEESKYYIQQIKGFGLYYRYVGPGHKKNRPSAADLAKKITF